MTPTLGRPHLRIEKRTRFGDTREKLRHPLPLFHGTHHSCRLIDRKGEPWHGLSVHWPRSQHACGDRNPHRQAASASASRKPLPRFASAATIYLLATTLPACVGLSTLQGPATLGQGRWQTNVEAAGQGAAGAAGSTAYPVLDISIRYGVTDSVDLGVRAGATGLATQAKFSLGRVLDGRLALAVLPQLSGMYLALGGKRASFVNLDVPLLLGVNVTERIEAVAAPRIVQTVALAHRSRNTVGAYVLSTGSTAGLLWRVSERISLMPEIGALVPVTGQGKVPDAGGGNISVAGADVLFQFSLGLLVRH